VLHNFRGGSADGCGPQAGVVIDSEGNLYGTTPTGGPSNGGVVYMVSKTEVGSGFVSESLWNCQVRWRIRRGAWYSSCLSGAVKQCYINFTSVDDCNTEPGLLQDSSGNLYGTARDGECGYNVVFMVTLSLAGCGRTKLGLATNT
jgi:uncharacterized repeat protein (TIGR03803 family)